MITDYIKTKLNLELIPEPGDKRFKAFDDGSVECVVGEFLYNLVRMVRPKEIIETGTYKGIACCYLGMAVKENSEGHIDTIEITESLIKEAEEKWRKLGISNLITAHHISSLEFRPEKMYDLLFLDSEPWLRFSELNRYWDNLKQGGLVIIHDLNLHLGERKKPWEDYVEKLGNKIKSHELSVISFSTPRPIVLMQKYHPEMGAWKILTGKI